MQWNPCHTFHFLSFSFNKNWFDWKRFSVHSWHIFVFPKYDRCRCNEYFMLVFIIPPCVISCVRFIAFIAYCSPTLGLPSQFKLAGNKLILNVCFPILGMMQINILTVSKIVSWPRYHVFWSNQFWILVSTQDMCLVVLITSMFPFVFRYGHLCIF